MKVLLINGSPRKNGLTASSLAIVEKILNEEGIETSWFYLGTDMVRGCRHCNLCQNTSRCFYNDDLCNQLIEMCLDADGIIIASPVYFAGPNGALCALLDRAFYAASNYGYHFAGKVGASIATLWRAGATATLDRINKYFSFSQMTIVSSEYWNMVHSKDDLYGKQILETLGKNMAKELRLRK